MDAKCYTPHYSGPRWQPPPRPRPAVAAGTSTQVTLSRFSTRRVVLVGLGLFLAALALILAALAAAAMALFLAGMVVGGVAVGAIFLGSLATANRLAPPGRRRQTVPAFFVACYAGMIIPVVGIGPAKPVLSAGRVRSRAQGSRPDPPGRR
jgi:MFS family permease